MKSVLSRKFCGLLFSCYKLIIRNRRKNYFKREHVLSVGLY